MARLKNALRGHFVADVTADGAEPTTWLELAKWISTVSDETDEETDDTGFYDGDGTPEMDVISITGAYSFEGMYDPTDKAQALIASKKYTPGEGRKIWHKVVAADNSKTWTGPATVSDIVAGSGDATAYEEFGCTITFNSLPTETAAPPEV